MQPDLRKAAGRRRAALRLVALAAGLPIAATAAGEPLGRLFFTPQERARLERQRWTGSPIDAAARPSSIRVGGVVARSGGRNTVWLNGTAIDAAGHDRPVELRPNAPAMVVVRVEPGRTARLKVGESIDLPGGDRHDGLGGGRVVVSTPATPSK